MPVVYIFRHSSQRPVYNNRSSTRLPVAQFLFFFVTCSLRFSDRATATTRSNLLVRLPPLDDGLELRAEIRNVERFLIDYCGFRVRVRAAVPPQTICEEARTWPPAHIRKNAYPSTHPDVPVP